MCHTNPKYSYNWGDGEVYKNTWSLQYLLRFAAFRTTTVGGSRGRRNSVAFPERQGKDCHFYWNGFFESQCLKICKSLNQKFPFCNSEMKVTCGGFQIQWTSILIVNSASMRLMFNPECLFLLLFPCVVLGFSFLFRDFSERQKKVIFFFPSWKKYFLSKETFKLSGNSQGYRGIFCNKLPSENRLAAALILRTAGFLGCGGN